MSLRADRSSQLHPFASPLARSWLRFGVIAQPKHGPPAIFR